MHGRTTSKGQTSVEDAPKMDNEDTLDQMVARASVPNLASLFQRGKEAGLIKPTTGYGEGAA
jgi:hypothetical protein